MKHEVFWTTSPVKLKQAIKIGEGNDIEEIIKIIKKNNSLADENPYWRFLLGEDATFIDFGSGRLYAAIIPPFQTEQVIV